MSRTVAVVQARMASTRLPGKVLMELNGVPMLAQELRRLRRARSLDEVVVATTTNAADDAVAAVAAAEDTALFRGSEQDVLARYLAASAAARADIVVRVTADCPLIDADVVDRVCTALGQENDYAANVVRRTFPHGLDVEAMHFDVIERLTRIATSAPAREHVTWFLREEHPELFRIRSVEDPEDNSDLRWTVDTQDDLDVVRRLYDEFALDEVPLPYQAVVGQLRRRNRAG